MMGPPITEGTSVPNGENQVVPRILFALNHVWFRAFFFAAQKGMKKWQKR